MSRIESRPLELPLSERADHLTQVGSRVVDAEIEKLRKQGHNVLPLTAHPERSLPPHVVEAAVAAVHNPHAPPSRGLPSLREAIASQLETEMSVAIDPEQQVLVTNGAMQALFVAFAALLEPGDEIIMPAPCFFVDGITDLLGLRLVYVQMCESQNFRWDHDRLAAAVTSRTRVVFVNTPMNPTGYVLTEDDLRFVTRLASKNSLWIVADESYDRMVYDDRRHLSILGLREAEQRAVLIRSCTKSFAMSAWRIGYLVAPASAIKTMVKVFEWQNLYGNAVCQAAAAAAIAGPQAWLVGVTQEFQNNRDTLYRIVTDIEGISSVLPQGGPFVFLNVGGLGVDGDIFAHRLLHDFGVATTPGSTLQSVDHVRLPFGGDLEVVAEVGPRLTRAARDIRH